MPDPTRLTTDELLAGASRALGKVDLFGRRGCSLVSLDEIEALAGLLAVLGLVPTPPGGPPPAAYFQTPRKDADHEQ